MFTPRKTFTHRTARMAAAIACVGLAVAVSACGGTRVGTDGARPVTMEPISPAPSASADSPSGPPAPKPSASPKPSPSPAIMKFVFPVVGKVSYAHQHHDYPATDIMAACGSEVRAVVNGVVLAVTRVDRWKPSVNAGATRGGLSVSIKGDDGIRYYGSHLEQIARNIQPGVRVTAGERLGKVGETGDASACHLHFGISPVCRGTGDWWIQRGVVWPWGYLDSWRSGGHKSPVAAVKAWQSTHGCPAHPLVDP